MKLPLDPEEQRWDRKYPRFPGVAKCVEFLHRTNVQSTWIDIICIELEKHAEKNSNELITATRKEIERNSGIGRMLLHVVADSKLPEALPLFAELLQSPDESLHPYAVSGLKQLNIKEARRLLWEFDETQNKKNS